MVAPLTSQPIEAGNSISLKAPDTLNPLPKNLGSKVGADRMAAFTTICIDILAPIATDNLVVCHFILDAARTAKQGSREKLNPPGF